MRDNGIGSWTARQVRRPPRAVAVVHEGGTLTYAEPEERVRRLAHGLGVRRGDRVAFLGPNQPAFLETLFATTRLGAVFVPLNIRLAEVVFRHYGQPRRVPPGHGDRSGARGA